MTGKDIHWLRFPVQDRGVCVWGAEPEDNAQFLDGVSPDFFIYEASTHQRALREAGDDTQSATYAALALRLSYGMALESLFAFLCAAVQAPHCVFGWISEYKNHELAEVVRRISTGEGQVLAVKPFRSSPLSWESIASTVFRPTESKQPELFAERVALHSRAWRTLAADFLSDDRQREYNAIKHGFRTQSGAMQLEISDPETSESLFAFESQQSHNFAYLKKKRKCHYDVRHLAVVLEPDHCVAGLAIVALSLHNLIGWLRWTLGYTKSLRVRTLTNFEDILAGLTEGRASVGTFSYGIDTQIAENEYVSENEILSHFRDEDGR